jgi:DNA-binding response OmpR family regulator
VKPEVAFECLLVSHDPAVFGIMGQILRDFCIQTNVCPNPSIAANLLTDGDTDLVVIDLESEHSSQLIREICESRLRQKPTILAVSTMDCGIPGVHVV